MIDIYDTKLWGIKFNLDAEYIGEQSIVLDVDGFLDAYIDDNNESIHVICPCHIVFVGVSGLAVNILDGSFQERSVTYSGGIHVIEIEKNTDSIPFSWSIQLDSENHIKIQCDSARVEVFEQFKKEVIGGNTFLSLSDRTTFMCKKSLNPSSVYNL